MIRTTLLHAACAAVSALTLGLTGTGLTGTAYAVPDGDPSASGSSSSQRVAASITCRGRVLGVTADRHVVSYSIDNGEVVGTRISNDRLRFRATAMGYRSSMSTERKGVFDANLMADDGVPRRVQMTSPAKNDNIRLDTSRYDQRRFGPSLFADGYTHFAYTAGAGRLTRWTLTKYPDGDVRYADPRRIATNLGLTSLQTGYLFKKDGVWREHLYATTRSGALQQIVVPLENPGNERIRTLRTSGYEGVTELSWALCNDNVKHTLLFAVDPVADTATWTTVNRSTTDPRTRLRGAISGDVSWDLTAAF